MKEHPIILDDNPAITLTFSCNIEEATRLGELMKKEDRTRSNLIQTWINEKWCELHPEDKPK